MSKLGVRTACLSCPFQPHALTGCVAPCSQVSLELGRAYGAATYVCLHISVGDLAGTAGEGWTNAAILGTRSAPTASRLQVLGMKGSSGRANCLCSACGAYRQEHEHYPRELTTQHLPNTYAPACGAGKCVCYGLSVWHRCSGGTWSRSDISKTLWAFRGSKRPRDGTDDTDA